MNEDDLTTDLLVNEVKKLYVNMNRTIYIISALVILASCTQEQPVVLYPDPDFASVELSSQSAVIPEEGGEKTIFVAANREEWEAYVQRTGWTSA